MATIHDTKVPVQEPGEKDPAAPPAQHVEYFDAKQNESNSAAVSEDLNKPIRPPATARELVTEILLVEDDPSVNPWTFRMWFIGIGMSVFAG